MVNESVPNLKINPDRLNYLLDLYRFSKEEFVEYLNSGLKRELMNLETLNKILAKKTEVNIRILNKMDTLFSKGITWYLSKRQVPEREQSSIFFRKDSFNIDLNLESKKKINYYEELKFEIQTLCQDINFDANKKLKDYKISDNPIDVAKELSLLFNKVEENLYSSKSIRKPRSDRDYLRNTIRVIESFNIFVFEFIETWNKKDRVNFNGFFISPNIIVLKKQKYPRREIFTLICEFAHYLLNYEEIDDGVIDEFDDNLSEVEKWCNTFAYYFLLNKHVGEFECLESVSKKNDFNEEEIDLLYNKTYLSKSAFYTRLRIDNKISQYDYDDIILKIRKSVIKKEEELQIQRDIEKQIAKEQGKKIIAIQKPIESNLFKEIVKMNFFEGRINENKLRTHLKIKSDKSIEEVIY